MVVTLSSSLAAHQLLARRRPAVRVVVSARRHGIDILDWLGYYSGSEPDMPQAAAVPADGSLLRARNTAGTVFTQRVPTPGPASTYSAWTNTATATSTTPIALAAHGTEALLAYIDNAGLTIQVRTSSDSGATWSAATAVVTEGTVIGALALAYSPNGDACLFYTLGSSGTALKRLRRTSGSWAASGTNWSRSGDVATLTGLTACHDGNDFALLITGSEATAGHHRAWAARMGDLLLPANAWSALVDVAEADSASTVTFLHPAIANIAGQLHGFFTQHESANVANDRAMYTRPTIGAGVSGEWSEPAPHEGANAEGVALPSAGGSDAWLTTAGRVWHASRGAEQEVSSAVISASYHLQPEGSTAEVVLDGTMARAAALAVGGTLTIQPGYQSGTAGVPEYGTGQSFTIDRIRTQATAGRATITVSAIGAWGALERWHAQQAWQTAASLVTRGAIFARIARRAGIDVTSASSPHDPSTDWTTYEPAFAIAAGESAGNVVRRLLAVVPDFVRDTAANGAMEITGLTASNPVVSYGGTGEMPLLALALDEARRPANWLRVQGLDRYADSLDFRDLYQHGPALKDIRNLDATTDAKATAWAANALAREITTTPRGR
ncbi:MAG: hypothetical protein ACRDG3_03650, partial [Tepidiformaceae bacterium]